MQRKYKILLTGLNCSMGWLVTSLMYFYYVSQAGAMAWLILFSLLMINMIFLIYNVKVIKNEIIVQRALFIRTTITSLLTPLLMLILGLLALFNLVYRPENFFIKILNESDMHLWLFVAWATLGASLIQFIALLMSVLPGTSEGVS